MIQPNISSEGLRLLWLDKYDVIPFAWAENRQAIDVSNRVFNLVFYEKDSTNMLLTIENDQLKKVPGRTDKRTWRPSEDDRNALELDTEYDVVLYELIEEGNETLPFYYAHFLFQWWVVPEGFVEGMPRKPPTVLINHVTATGAVIVLSVYEVPQGPVPYPSILAALTAQLPSGQTDQPCYVIIDGQKQYYYKDAAGLWPQLMGDQITLSNYQSV